MTPTTQGQAGIRDALAAPLAWKPLAPSGRRSRRGWCLPRCWGGRQNLKNEHVQTCRFTDKIKQKQVGALRDSKHCPTLHPFPRPQPIPPHTPHFDFSLGKWRKIICSSPLWLHFPDDGWYFLVAAAGVVSVIVEYCSDRSSCFSKAFRPPAGRFKRCVS